MHDNDGDDDVGYDDDDDDDDGNDDDDEDEDADFCCRVKVIRFYLICLIFGKQNNKTIKQ